MAQFMVVLDATVVNVAFRPSSAGSTSRPPSFQWVVNAYTLMFGGFLMWAGAPRTFSAASACSSRA